MSDENENEFLLVSENNENIISQKIKKKRSSLSYLFILITCTSLALIFFVSYTTTRPITSTPNLTVQYPMVSLKYHIDNDNVNEEWISKCKELWISQPMDHFGQSDDHRMQKNTNTTFMQRYFICSDAWEVNSGPVFFYLGNEANVELYLNHTGLMWENRHEFKAMLVFAEHRYFGKTTILENENMQFLSSEQALADYATLITFIKGHYFPKQHASTVPVIGFGGSYGGMLASWFRMKYPHMINGAIAASAPILSFAGENPKVDPSAFFRIITQDATSAKGSSPNCANNIRSSWKLLTDMGNTVYGRSRLARIFHLCRPLKDASDVSALASWAQDAYSSMAMG